MLLGFRYVGWLVVAGLVLAGGCGGDQSLGGGSADDGGTADDDGSDDSSVAAGLGEPLASFVVARCDRIEQCECTAQHSDDCVDEATAAWEARIAAAEQRGLTRDDACIEANLATLSTAGCAWPRSALGTEQHLCTSFCAAFHGDRQLGQSCDAVDALASDCAQGLLCDAGVCVEPCAALEGLNAGQTCSPGEFAEPFEDCGPDLYCDWQAGTCVAAAQPGGGCFDTDCAQNLWCDYETGTCRAAAAEGESCELSGRCEEGLYCDWSATTPTCRPPSSLGQSCASAPCVEGLACSSTSVCVEPPTAGQPCAGGQCAEGALCDWNVDMCVTPPPVGAPCLFGECGQDLWCDTAEDPQGRCAVRKPVGDPCSGHGQCEAGYCPAGYCLPRPALGEDCSVVLVCERGLVCDGQICRETINRAPAACVYPGW